MLKKLSKILIVIILFVTIFALGHYSGNQQTEFMKTQTTEEVDLSLFWEAYSRLKTHYVSPEEIDEQTVVHGAIRGMLDALDDPHTSFFDREESAQFLESVSGYYEGVGMEVGIRGGEIKVISPIEGTPAAEAGIRSGDVIVKINDESTFNMNLQKAVDLMRGAAGTEVAIVIERNRERIEKKINRAKIQIPSVEWSLLEDDIVYLKIYYFHNELINEFNEIVPEIMTSPSDKMILDLRNNPGGALDAALEVSEFFFERGDVIVKSQGADGKVEEEYRAGGSSVTFDHDLVVLINEGSASASEIMAGALRHHKNAKIVGRNSFGKGSIQTMVNLSDMSNLKITVSNWVTPDGILITDEGIKPDFEKEITVENFKDEIDPQLDKAIEIIKK